MAKLTKAPEEIQNVVQEISSELGLDVLGVDFEALYTDKQKEAAVVKKASQVAEYFSNRSDLVLVMLNEKLFESGVEEKTKYLWLRMAMDVVSYDTEKDRLIIGCPMISIPVGFYEKFKGAAVDACLLAHYTMKQIADKEKEEKARNKENKGRGRKNN